MFTSTSSPNRLPLLPINQLGSTEKDAIDAIETYQQRYNAYPFLTSATRSDTSFQMSALYYAVKKNYLQLARRLLEDGIPIEVGILSTNDKTMTTPLMLACRENSEAMTALLLEFGADLLKISPEGFSLLHVVQSSTLCRFIMEDARQKECLKELLNLPNTQQLIPFIYACRIGKAEIAKELIMVDNLATNYIKPNTFLHEARQAYFLHGDQQKIFDEICDILRPDCKIYIRNRQSQNHVTELSSVSAYEEIFGKGTVPFLDDMEDKTERIKFVISQIYAIFNSPAEFDKYLQFMNEEFVRYLTETNVKFIRFGSGAFYFKEVDGSTLPIPTDNFKSFKQAHLLKEFLISVLSAYGLAKHAYKWLGFIPAELANKMLREGDFCLESRRGLGLFHNTLSHMIQLVLSIYILQNGVCLDKSLTIQDILGGLIDIPWRSKFNLWIPARDTRKFKRSALSDPFELGSLVMRRNNEMGDALIDIFCRGLLEIVKIFNEDGRYGKFTVDTFTNKMNDFYMENFIIPPFLFNYDLEKATQKEKEKFTSDNKTYAIVPIKNLHFNALFKPKVCQFKTKGSSSYTNTGLFI